MDLLHARRLCFNLYRLNDVLSNLNDIELAQRLEGAGHRFECNDRLGTNRDNKVTLSRFSSFTATETDEFNLASSSVSFFVVRPNTPQDLHASIVTLAPLVFLAGGDDMSVLFRLGGIF